MDRAAALPAPGACHIWHAPADRVDPRLAAVLAEEERARWQALRDAAEQRRYLAAHVLTRLAIGAALGIAPAALRFVAQCNRCGGTGHGKPRLDMPPTPLHFSLSHAGACVAVALATSVPVGLDLEPRGAVVTPAMAALFLSDAERQRHRATALLRLWTRKEAVLKATGDGLSADPRRVDLGEDGSPIPIAGSPHTAYLHDFDPDPDHIGTIATLNRPLHPHPRLAHFLLDAALVG